LHGTASAFYVKAQMGASTSKNGMLVVSTGGSSSACHAKTRTEKQWGAALQNLNDAKEQ
jgi:hypothetical protein